MFGEGNGIDYGFRCYDARIGRFLSVDPLASYYPWYTPYQFAGNTPIWAIDLDGLEEYTQQELHAIENQIWAEIKKLDSRQVMIANRGMADAMLNANMLGLTDFWGSTDNIDDYRSKGDRCAYIRGRMVGDAGAILQSFVEIDGGLGTAAAGLATGPGATVASTVGLGVAAHGAGVGVAASIDLGESLLLYESLSDGGGSSESEGETGTTLTESQLSAIRGHEKQIAKHRQKLEDYKANPEMYDNKGFLKNAPDEATRQKIIDSRIRHLEGEIKVFQDNIQKIVNGEL